MTKKFNTPWEVGSLFICTKCGAKYNLPNLAEELKSEIRRELKGKEKNSKIRVMTSSCLNVCYPEEQTFAFMPNSGETEMYTSTLDKATALADIQNLIQKKLS